MSVRISSELLQRIVAEAVASRDEICGLLFGSDAEIITAQPCRNVAISRKTRFEIDPAALIAAHRAARAGGPSIVGCYHSHPSGPAAPSRQDAADAAPNGWLWLVVGEGQVRAFRAVVSGAVHGRFDPVVLHDGRC